MRTQVAANTTIFEAIREGKVDEVRKLLDRAPDQIRAKMSNGFEPLHWAALWDQLEIAKLLLERGANIHARTRFGAMTPLHFAKSAALGELLLSHGADLNARDEQRRTPLHRAAWDNLPEMARFLVARGAEISPRDVHDKTPLVLAEEADSTEVAELILGHGGTV